MKGNWSIVRQVVHRRFSTVRSSVPSSRRPYLSSLVPISMSSQNAINSIGASTEFNFSNSCFPRWRSLCSAAGCNRSIGQNSVVAVRSEEEFVTAMSKAQGGSLPSIFYFTAAWCGPCRFISPVIVELSEKYPHVTTYKVDIDEGGLSHTISKLSIAAVPTLHFFKEGLKKAEIVGADVTKLKNLMEQLYK